ncbi:MAG: hypothetical protein NTX12_02485 [Actinobacteria bacterium]|nr:hypothetical protein [Actinomycetota bacterium]
MSAYESKPEWFQMADEDWATSPAAVKMGVKTRRKNPIQLMAISAPILVLGAGLFFAQTQSAPTSFASPATTVAAPASNPSSSASSAPTESAAPVVNTPSSTVPMTNAPSASNASSQTGFAPLSATNGGLVLPAKISGQSDDDGDSDEGQYETEDD